MGEMGCLGGEIKDSKKRIKILRYGEEGCATYERNGCLGGEIKDSKKRIKILRYGEKGCATYRRNGLSGWRNQRPHPSRQALARCTLVHRPDAGARAAEARGAARGGAQRSPPRRRRGERSPPRRRRQRSPPSALAAAAPRAAAAAVSRRTIWRQARLHGERRRDPPGDSFGETPHRFGETPPHFGDAFGETPRWDLPRDLHLEANLAEELA